jgi:hypothetical protein
MLLLGQEDFVLLYDIQRARADLYGIYRLLLSYRDVVRQARAWLDRKASSSPDAIVSIGAALEPRIIKTGRGGAVPDPQGMRQDDDLSSLRSAAAGLRSRSDELVEAAEVLRHANLVTAGLRENIFGVVIGEGDTADLLDCGDLLLPEGIPPARAGEVLRSLDVKAERSIRFLQDRFLWQEWFVREAPFVLSEEITGFIEKVRRGEEIDCDTARLTQPAHRKRLRDTFSVFCECTRQGIYLTDVLLQHISRAPPEEWPGVIREDLTRRRIMVSDGRVPYRHITPLEKHLQFTTFAHDYRYGKESLEQPSLVYLWLRYLAESGRVKARLGRGPWPSLPRHPHAPRKVGPLTAKMYAQHASEARAVRDLIFALHDRSRREGFPIRVIPNLTYGLFCIAPVMNEILQRGIHVSFAGISSRLCDDENINEFYLADNSVFPLKRYVFSNASNYGTLNQDRLLVVIDGTMEPIDRHDARRARLPKAYRGFVNHLVAVNYVRARHGYEMENAEREVASALNLSRRFVQNLLRTHDFRHLLDSLLHCFDPEELRRSHAAAGTGKTYYSFAQWNPDGMPARIGPIGYERREVPCVTPDDLPCPSLLFVSMNSLFNPLGVSAFFDNNAEVEHPRMFIGPRGVKIDIGWPDEMKGIELFTQ